MSPHTDAGALLKLAEIKAILNANLKIGGHDAWEGHYYFVGGIDAAAEAIVTRQAASRGSAGGERSEVQSGDADLAHPERLKALSDAAAYVEMVGARYHSGRDIANGIRCLGPQSPTAAQTSAVKISEPVAWQYREKIPNGTWGIWRHCDVVREDTNLDYRPLYLGVAQAQTGCDKEATFGEAGYNPAYDDGITFAIVQLAELTGSKDWQMRDGSEDHDTDVRDTIMDVLKCAGIYDDETGKFAALAQEASDCGAEIKRLRAQVEYWRLAAERREARKERSGVDAAEARTLDAPEYHAGEHVSLPSAHRGGEA